MKKPKTKRTKWSYERAKQLDQERTTTPLSWGELGKKYGQSPGAIKASINRWLEKAPAAARLKAKDLAAIDQPKTDLFHVAETEHGKAMRTAKAWGEIMELIRP